MSLKSPLIFDHGERIFLVGPVTPRPAPSNPAEELAFGGSIIDGLRKDAPNEALQWFAGHYVEADTPNKNGAMWSAKELQLKSVTARFMPITVMHDPATAVGMIGDTRLLTPDKDGVPRSKIETALAVWAHRFPDIAEEAMHNYAEGTLMQSMECLAPHYECSACGQGFHKLPGDAEQEHWCDHLKGEGTEQAARILQDVTFTGTGLIFGSRGAEGADPSARLEAFQTEVAEFHDRSHTPNRHTPKHPSKDPSDMSKIEIEKSEYDRIVAERDENRTKAETAEAARAAAVKKQEEAEVAKTAAETAKSEAEKKAQGFEEQARADALANDRIGKLDDTFLAKLGKPNEGIRARLDKQATEMSDEDWAERVDELRSLVGEENGGGDPTDDGGDTAAKDETARFQAGASVTPGRSKTPSIHERGATVSALLG